MDDHAMPCQRLKFSLFPSETLCFSLAYLKIYRGKIVHLKRSLKKRFSELTVQIVKDILGGNGNQ